MTTRYDFFVSYARKDAPEIDRLVKRLCDVFERIAKRPARPFIDRRGIKNAQQWEKHIDSALQSSEAFLPIVTPASLRSTWCAREWDSYLIIERKRKKGAAELESDISSVFPIYLLDSDSIRNPSATRRLSEMRERQFTDLRHLGPRNPSYAVRIEAFVTDLVRLLKQSKKLKARKPNLTALEKNAPSTSFPLVAGEPRLDVARLSELLASARVATIVGVTNSWLPLCLSQAIDQKKQREGPHAFWDQLNVVFLADNLLPHVRDELNTKYTENADASRARLQTANQARRMIMSLLLRSASTKRWKIYSHPYILRVSGVLMSTETGKAVVILAVPRGSQPDSHHFQLDLLDRVHPNISAAFDEIVEHSREEHEIVLVGRRSTNPESFVCTETRFRRSVLVDGQNGSDWLGAVVVPTWRQSERGPEILLQVNTPQNSTREIGKASHVSGYINPQDCFPLKGSANPSRLPGEFILGQQEARHAAVRELADIGIAPSSPAFLATVPFIYFDKENLLFYLFEQEVPSDHKFDESVQIFRWSVAELIRLRRHQVFQRAIELLRAIEMTIDQFRHASRIVALNMAAHGDNQYSDEFGQLSSGGEIPNNLGTRLQTAASETSVVKYQNARRVYVEGIAGLQYRAFFSHLLPTYTKWGVAGAADAVDQSNRDAKRRRAVKELNLVYQDEDLMTAIPIEV